MNRKSSRSGAVLLLVLCILVLLSVIAVAFLLSSSNHYLLAKGYSHTTDARLLADSACQLAIGQIQTATGVNTGSTTIPPLWFSQPGLIRTIGSGTYTAYKLYSAPQMVLASPTAAGAFNPESLNDVPTDWSTTEAVDYVDINSPVSVNSSILSSTLLYPIVDPSVNTAAGPPSPSAAVQGFWYTNANSTAPADNVTSFATTSNPLPMPVRWLYVLQDGTIVTLDATGKSPVSTKSNPIVGRMAFWTDDETCKININTAGGDEWNPQWNSGVNPANPLVTNPDGVSPYNSGLPAGPNGVPIPGSFTSLPYTTSPYDYYCLFTSSPVANEYQRFPGHPATTYLSAVFPSLNRQQLAQLAPRIGEWTTTSGGNNGSNGGTSKTITFNYNYGNGFTTVAGTAINTVPTGAVGPVRLYDSLDELEYAPVVAAASPSGSPAPRLDLSSVSAGALQPILTPTQVQNARFFLSAHSSAPEINVFGRPRVSIWPLSAKVSSWTAFDKVAGLSSSLGQGTNKSALFFSRYYAHDTSSPTATSQDASLSPNGGTYVSGNTQLYSYLQAMMSLTVPGHTQSLSTKFGTDANQILTEIFDYIRTTNLDDPNAASAPYQQYSPSGAVSPLIESNGTQGFGRVPVLNRAALIFYLVSENGGYSVQSIFAPSFFWPVMGQVGYNPNMEVVVSGLDSIKIYGGNTNNIYYKMGFPTTGQNNIPAGSWIKTYPFIDEESLGGTSFNAQFVSGCTTPYPFRSIYQTTPPSLGVPLSLLQPTGQNWANDVSTANTSQNHILTVTGGTITVSIYLSDTAGSIATPYYTRTYSFPWATMKVPLPSDVSGHDTGGADARTLNATAVYLRPVAQGNSPQSDSAAGMEVTDPNQTTQPSSANSAFTVAADYRMLALEPSGTNVSTWWHPHLLATNGVNFNEAGFPLAPGTMGLGDPETGNASESQQIDGNLLDFSSPLKVQQAGNTQWFPDFPSSLDNNGAGGARMKNGNLGDWSSAEGLLCDGAYVSKADEGGSFFPFGSNNPAALSSALFSPNRQVPSPIVFGSLPTGFKRGQPWQTLLFCPDPAARTTGTDVVTTAYDLINDTSHPGFADPPDHLLLDLFYMPVVEPYAISEPFATSGKVNLNYQIVPFTYIHRDTALRAVLRSTMITAIPTVAANTYKETDKLPSDPATESQGVQANWPIELDKTLSRFDSRFAANTPFQTASEICSMYLFPANINTLITPQNVQDWWNGANGQGVYPIYNGNASNTTGFALTGDNLREQPYNQIYSRLTTQSNSYTVHVWAQTLTQTPASKSAGIWNPSTDQITGEYRGSYLIERYLSPNITSYSMSSAPSLNNQYKMRIVASRVFNP